MKTSPFIVTVNSAVAAVLVALLAVLYFTPPESAAVGLPRQDHHVIYIAVCGVIEGVIITSNPPQIADHNTPMTPEMLDIELEAFLAGRYGTFVAGLDVVCSDLQRAEREIVR